MGKHRFEFEVKGNYIGGEFRQPEDANGELKNVSPADFEDATGTYRYYYADVDRAVDAARAVYRKWRRVPVAERASLLKRYEEALKRNTDRLVEAIAREIGKPVWEAKTEVSAMVGKIGITINESLKLVEGFRVDNIMPGVAGVCRYHSMGVMAVLGPFNFPGHLANGHIVPALLTGNTIVFKPSEKSPMVGQLMAECFAEAGFPAGVFNLVQGEKEVGRRLAVHEHVSGVLFTGSYEVGTRIKQDTLQQHWKILALEMGGKNSSIVWKDAEIDNALRECLIGAYLTTGQRCSATSRIIVHRSILEPFLERFHERSKSFSIDHPFENPFMGSLIDKSSVDRYMKFLGIAQREGCEIIMRGKEIEASRPGCYVSPSICLVKDGSVEHARKSVYQQTELFAPNVAIIPADDIEQAIELVNATQFGLAASVFTTDRGTYERCEQELEAGVINWNKSTVGASSRLPFGGVKKSGNHFPTALTSTQYCMYPVASLEIAEPKGAAGDYPGLNWS